MADLGEVVGDKTWNALFRQCRESFVAMEECRQRSGLGDSQDVERTEKACPRETEALRGCLQEKWVFPRVEGLKGEGQGHVCLCVCVCVCVYPHSR